MVDHGVTKKARLPLLGIMPFMLIENVYWYLNPNFRLNDGGESCMRSLKRFFKFPLNELKEQGHYDPDDETHR